VRTDPYGSRQVVSPHTEKLAQRVRTVIGSPSDRLDELVRVAGLDPASDLRFGDWHGLDLAGADLRGFDFTGADLTGVRFDRAVIAGAIFDRATVERSALSAAADFNESFSAKPRKRFAGASNDEVAVELYVIADEVKRYPANTGATGERGYVGNLAFADLVEAVGVDRDRRAFAALYDHFAPRINAYLTRSGVTPASAGDLTQEVMAKLWARANQFDRNRSTVSTWLFRIARNARIDHLRGQRGERPLGEEALSVPDSGQAPDDAVSGLQWEERVRAAMSSLPPKQLAMVKLAFFDGLSHREIAEQTGLPLGTVKARIRLALARLRRGL
jgi:RNA polymerase sigma factor (sigma-70 family)